MAHRALINNIRRQYGFDDEMLQDPAIASTITALRSNLAQALESLSKELYSKPSHFVLEFMQNAADNVYADDVGPTLNVTVRDRSIVFKCNEVGFNEANVEAICKIGASTKRNQEGFIGEKGIGFKSVFRVADVVHISSREYTFKLDKREELGMITPTWNDSEHPVIPGWTSFHLELSPCEDPHVVASYIRDINPSLLLFLGKLREMTIDIKLEGDTQDEIVKLVRKDVDSGIVVLEDSRSSPERFLMVKHMTRIDIKEAKRMGVEESEILLAFPLTENGMPKIEEQPQAVHAFLPIKSFGFTFIIQADFLTAANREHILVDLPWNTTLRDGVKDAFLEAVNQFQDHPTLKFVWFRFLPNMIDPFFSGVARSIKDALQGREIFRSTDGQYRLPSQCIILPPEFCDRNSQPLIPDEFLGDLHYLSPSYDVGTDASHFKGLEVRTMSSDDFITGLKNMNHIIHDRPSPWQESVCEQLYNMCRTTTQQQSKYDQRLVDIKQLCILPLANGTWISASSEGDIFFDSETGNVPLGLNLRHLIADIIPGSHRYLLFLILGVKGAVPQEIARKILELHRGGPFVQPLKSFIQHARFLYVHRYTKGVPRPTDLGVVAQDGYIVKGTDVYCDFPDIQRTIRLTEVLPAPAKFLHSDYLKEQDWWNWLREEVGVNYFPCLVNDGALSPTFLKLAQTMDTPRLLTLLKETWSQWQGSLSTNTESRLGEIKVTCEDGIKRSLNATYLRRPGLMKYPDIPFLPVTNPELREWDFLSDLGVTHQVDGDFFLKRLIRWSTQGYDDEEMIRSAYEQIQARFEENPKGIMTAFDEKRLIFASCSKDTKKKWINKSDAIWTGFPSIKSKAALADSYASLQKLFHDHIGITAAGPEVLVEELTGLARHWRRQTITSTVNEHVSALLVDIARVMSKTEPYDSSPKWLRKLSHEPIFPVEALSFGLVLCASDGYFYIPDSNGRYQEVFGKDVPLLSLAAPPMLHHIKPILSSPCFESRLKYLERSVTRVSRPSGSRSRDTHLKNKYASRSNFVKRLVARNPCPTRKTLEILQNFEAIDILKVNSIESTYSLEGHSHTRTENVAVELDESKISVLISDVSRLEPDVSICKELASLLDVPMPTLFMSISMPPETVEGMMNAEGISDIPEGFLLDPGFEGVHAQVDMPDLTARPVDDQPQGEAGAFRARAHAAPTAPPAAQFIFDESQMEDIRAGIRNMGQGSVQPDRVVGSAFNSGLVSPTPISKTAREAADPSSSGGDAQSGRGSQSDGYRRVNMVLGECFIYKTLAKVLPGFGPENWKSLSRSHVPGMPRYSGPQHVASFCYDDSQGILTSMVYDENTKEAWTGRWPIYHIAVQSTSGKASEPFHMNQTLVEHTLRLTASDPDAPPKGLSAIIRVSNVRTCPTYSIYRDPHRLFYEGKLRITSGVDVTLNE